MSSPVAVGPNHLSHYNPSQQHDIHDNSWDQNQLQPHNTGGLVQVPPTGHGPVVIGSSNTGTLPRRPGGSKPPVVIRKSPENSQQKILKLSEDPYKFPYIPFEGLY